MPLSPSFVQDVSLRRQVSEARIAGIWTMLEDAAENVRSFDEVDASLFLNDSALYAQQRRVHLLSRLEFALDRITDTAAPGSDEEDLPLYGSPASPDPGAQSPLIVSPLRAPTVFCLSPSNASDSDVSLPDALSDILASSDGVSSDHSGSVHRKRPRRERGGSLARWYRGESSFSEVPPVVSPRASSSAALPPGAEVRPPELGASFLGQPALCRKQAGAAQTSLPFCFRDSRF